MMRLMLALLVGVLFCGTLSAGKFADNVKDLGDSAKRPMAAEKLARAGAEAYDDLIDGLKREPKGDGADSAADSQIRLACARLLGLLGDTRASADLLRLFKAEAIETSSYPELAGACALALGQIWAVKPVDGTRTEVVTELRRVAAYETISPVIKLGCLHGLAGLREGAEIAAPLVKDAKEGVIRSAAIAIVVACQHKASADDLLAIWATQRGGEATKYTEPMGLQSLFGLAVMGDARAAEGLVDVATLNQFALNAGVREQATEYLKGAALRRPALDTLKSILKADDKPTQWRQAAITLGELGADGITALLAVADEPAPEGKEADWYKRRVDDQLSALSSETALKAFAGAYEAIPATEERKALREKVLDQLLRYRTSLKEEGINLFRKAADDATIEAPKRAQCMNAYAESRAKDALPDLERWIKAEDAVIRAQAALNVGRSYIPIGKAQPLLVEAMKSAGADFHKVRMNCLQGLQRSDDKALLQVFLDAMDPAKEESPEVRREAVMAVQSYRRIAKLKEEDVFDAIKARTADADANVRSTAVSAATGMAQRMGRKNTVVEILEKALKDDSKDVRMQAYGQVNLAVGDLKLDTVLDAALKETATDARGDAVMAITRMGSMAGLKADDKRLELLVEMTVQVVENQSHRAPIARELLGKLDKDAGAFSIISRLVLAALDRNSTANDKRPDRLAQLVPVLAEIKEYESITRVKKLAEEPNVELRRACVLCIGAIGTKDDIAFLRTLRDRTDGAAGLVRADIEEAIRMLEER
ncbi:MAG: HEAT repeat domain-containing protein [Planctomycetes bacterium]|nr:HEAT repeat domain-containing protein [Planctomycetota bacterium]